jgi:hypothetical protein
MKAKFMFLASLLSLTACGGGPAISDITPGDEVSKGSFEAAYSLNNILLHSNYHVEVSYTQTGLPEQAMILYSKSMDFADKKIKVYYNLYSHPYYFDFSRSNDSAAYTFDLYYPEDDHAKEPTYKIRTFTNISLSNDFMSVEELLQVTSGVGLSLMSGLGYSDFAFSGGVYTTKNPIKHTMSGVEATFDVIKTSFLGDNPKEFYYRLSGEVPTSEAETITLVAEEKAVYSKYGQVSITLPDVVD